MISLVLSSFFFFSNDKMPATSVDTVQISCDPVEYHVLSIQQLIKFQHLRLPDDLTFQTKKRKQPSTPPSSPVENRPRKKKSVDLFTVQELHSIKPHEEYLAKKLTGYDGWLAFPKDDHFVMMDAAEFNDMMGSPRKIIRGNWYRHCKSCRETLSSKTAYLQHMESEEHLSPCPKRKEVTPKKDEGPVTVDNRVYDMVDNDDDRSVFRKHSNRDVILY